MCSMKPLYIGNRNSTSGKLGKPASVRLTKYLELGKTSVKCKRLISLLVSTNDDVKTLAATSGLQSDRSEI